MLLVNPKSHRRGVAAWGWTSKAPKTVPQIASVPSFIKYRYRSGEWGGEHKEGRLYTAAAAADLGVAFAFLSPWSRLFLLHNLLPGHLGLACKWPLSLSDSVVVVQELLLRGRKMKNRKGMFYILFTYRVEGAFIGPSHLSAIGRWTGI